VFGAHADWKAELEAELSSLAYSAVISFGFVPEISAAVRGKSIRYLSWVDENPHIPLYTKEAFSANNEFFLFDREMCRTYLSYGLPKVHHLPLAVNAERLNRGFAQDEKEIRYRYPITFIGDSTEADVKWMKRLPDELHGYLDGLVAAQRKIWGYNFAKELITNSIAQELETGIPFPWREDYYVSRSFAYADYMNQVVSSVEYQEIADMLRKYYQLNIPRQNESELPEIFRTSKINLHVSSRASTSGIAYHALEIMGSGGFLLSNYQPELAEYFEYGKEFVWFASDEDLMDKVQYYLEHEQERQEIANQGWKKVKELFSYPAQVRKMLGS
jgi:spore maturation protein CgeB